MSKSKSKSKFGGSDFGVLSQCALCRRRVPGSVPAKCEAYPAAIPAAILANDRDHRDPAPGDGGLLFAPRDDAAPDALGRLDAHFARPLAGPPPGPWPVRKVKE